MFCKRCRYNLTMIESRRCPECGRAFDAGDAKTYRKSVGWPKWLRRFFQWMLVFFTLVLVALGVIEVRYQREMAAAKALEKVGVNLRWAWSQDAHQWAKCIPFLHERLQYVDYSVFTVLGFPDGPLTTLPPEIGRFTALERLYLSSEQLTTLPPEIGKLTKLTMLDIHDNPLISLPPEIGKLTNLKELDLRGNQFITPPSECWNITNLRHLFFGGNQINTLPAEIGKLTNLEVLGLNDNEFTTLPPEIGKLANLEGLSLQGNQLTTLPPEIGKLAKLQVLHLNANPITDADLEHLKLLASLKELNLSGTKVTKKGVATLKLALPKCRIESDFDQPLP